MKRKERIGIWVILFGIIGMSANGQFWHRTNPGGGGWMMSVGAGPTGTILVGSDLSGAYRSNDGGQSWDVIGATRGLTATHVSAVGFDPIDGDIFYLGTNRGIYRTTNGGDSITHVFNPGGASRAVIDVQISEANPNVGYATYHPVWNGTQGVVYKTIDRGLSWLQVSVDLPNTLRLLKVVIHPDSSHIVYVLSGFDRFECGPFELYRSTNGGVNWTELATSISDTIQLMDIAIDPITPSTLYLTSMNVSCTSGVRFKGDISKSIDGGDTWFDPNPLVERSGAIWIKRNDPSTIRLIDIRKTAPWVSTSGTYTSTDAGVNWTKTGDETNWETFYHNNLNGYGLGDVIHKSYGNNLTYCHTLGEDLSDPDKIYWVNKRFVFGTDDGGTIFRNLFTDQLPSGGWQSRGVDNVIIHDIEISPSNPNLIYVGFDDNGLWRSLDGGASWQSCNLDTYTSTWNGFGGNTYTVAPDPHRAKVVWAVLRGTKKCHVVRSDSAGKIDSWVLSNAGIRVSERITDLAVDPNSTISNRTLYVVDSGTIYKSVDDGYNWSQVYNGGGVWFVEVDKHNGSIVYAGGSAGFIRSTDGGSSWVNTGHAEMDQPGNTKDFWTKSYRGVSCIFPSNCSPGVVWVTAYGPSKGLYKSFDFGATWSKIDAGNHMRSVAVSENNDEVIFTGSSFVGNDGGFVSPGLKSLRHSLDGGNTWMDNDAELIYPSVVDLELNHSNPEKLFLASQGTGVQWAFDWVGPKCAAPVTMNSIASFHDVDLTWPCDSSTVGYVLRGGKTSAPGFVTINLSQPNCGAISFSNLDQCTEYWWQVKPECCTSVDLEWSSIDTFTTNCCLAPASTFTHGVTNQNAVLNWAVVSSALGYKLKGGSEPGGTVEISVSASASSYDLNANGIFLNPGQTYKWKVSAICDTSSNVDAFSEFTPFEFFTTTSLRISKPDDQRIQLFPNPACEVVFLTGIRKEGEIQFFDLSGNVHLKKDLTINQQDQVSISIMTLSAGIYLWEIVGIDGKKLADGRLVKH